MVDLKAIYLTALERCAPERLVREQVTRDMPRNVVAIGKCAGAMLDGVAAVHPIEHAFVALPEGYRRPSTPAEVHIGGHPQITPSSFTAGRALLRFVERHDDLLFLVSGGGSACVEVALHDEQSLIEENARLIASGLPIARINERRKTLSAIKGGKLRERVRGRCVTLVLSDVSTGRETDVASGPTAGGELILVADNSTLVRAAAEIIGDRADVLEEQLEGDVDEAAETLARRAAHGCILVAGGEPTVRIRGNGKGGRCTELAVRFAMRARDEALFAASDGVDGNSGVAGIHLPRRGNILVTAEWEAALAVSDSLRIAAQIGEPIMIAATGNNLRDLFLVARD
ncbi:MAG TPA: DUF4147 domain-containing protein [Thermoanaerobaculia bacterium]|jgi:hydroxypyruvate reductase